MPTSGTPGASTPSPEITWETPVYRAISTPAEALSVFADAVIERDACQPAHVSIQFTFVDAAAGTRYGQIRLRNTGTEPCVIGGYPGFGATGNHQELLAIEAERSAEDVNRQPVPTTPFTLAPEQEAHADVVWSGEIAGAQDSGAHRLATQITKSSPAVWVEVSADDVADLAVGSTVRLSPWQQ